MVLMTVNVILHINQQEMVLVTENVQLALKGVVETRKRTFVQAVRQVIIRKLQEITTVPGVRRILTHF